MYIGTGTSTGTSTSTSTGTSTSAATRTRVITLAAVASTPIASTPVASTRASVGHSRNPRHVSRHGHDGTRPLQRRHSGAVLDVVPCVGHLVADLVHEPRHALASPW